MDPVKQPTPTRQVKMLMINPPDFMALFKKGLQVRGGWKIIKGLPPDAKLLTIAYEPTRNGVMLVVESASYTAIPINEVPPIEVVEIELSGRHVKKAK